MGMFDYVRVEQRLPDGSMFDINQKYQTKSFDNYMETYVITNKGDIYRERWLESDWIEDSKSFLGGYLRVKPESYRREYLTDLNMDVIFYTSHPIRDNRVWRDYYARFQDGKLVKMWYEDKQY